MLLIGLSWIYILFTSVNLGFGFHKIIGIKDAGLLVSVISGLFSVSLIGCFWSIFGRVNFEFHLFLLLLNVGIYFRFRPEINQLFHAFRTELKQLILPLQLFLSIIAVLIIAQCATAPFVIDNESSYIQTIKWINEYGFVKGLANLHIALGQASGWHITQSVFSFSFLYKNFNDLSGFCLLAGNCFAVIKLNGYFLNANKNALIAGLFPLANVFFFQLISAPSPDIPVYVCAFVLFYYFIETFENADIYDLTLLMVLAFFIFFIKATSVGLVLVPVVLLVTHFRKFAAKLLPVALLGIVVLALFVIKNTIISGLPLFPMNFRSATVDFAVPDNMLQFYTDSGKMCIFSQTRKQLHAMDFGEFALAWLFASKITGFFNTMTVLILAISPVFIYRYFNRKALWIVYLVSIIVLAVLLLSSPVYRYFIYLTFFFGFFIFGCIFNTKRLILTAYSLSILAAGIVLFFPINFDSLTKNNLISQNSPFSVGNLIFPHQNSKLGDQYELVQKGNLKYYSPQGNPFFWATGDGNLPCVNKLQINYNENYFLVIPQMRTQNLGDGFYSKKINP